MFSSACFFMILFAVFVKLCYNKREEIKMQKQEYRLESQESFHLQHIFECGQCFRWNCQADGSYIGVVKNAVIHVKKDREKIIFKGKCQGDFQSIVRDYFDLDHNYDHMKEELAKVDDFMRKSTEFGQGIRILHQDFWECIISFIISANNNIPRIKKTIERISKEYGNKIEFEGKAFYTFPTPEQLGKATVEDLRKLGLGFRDKRVYETTRKILQKEFDLESVQNLESTDLMREELLKLDGVGEKVADCILLFALQKFDVFPIDVWVRRVMNELYIHQEQEEKVSRKVLHQLAQEKFQNLSGIAQQYLFYWKRETS